MSTQDTQTHPRDEIRAKIEAHEANLAELDAIFAECLANANTDAEREGAEETIQRCRELILATHEEKIAELEAKRDELVERLQRAGAELNAVIRGKEAYIVEILETGNPDGVTIEQIDAKYDPRIAELNRAYGDAMRAVAIFNGYRDEFLDDA